MVLADYYDPELVVLARMLRKDEHDLNNFLMAYLYCTGHYGDGPYASEHNAKFCRELLQEWVKGGVDNLQKKVNEFLFPESPTVAQF